ncbi:MAG: prepilin-type N-terminal cleavage/methylation domain-containing protein [bacterium]|nr:prepilin-type N-terminal cleavage/methylation domain-containing protein [bacterium]
MGIFNLNFNKKAFTLLELMIVIVILGVLAALISGNFITSLKKGRDAARKSDLEQVQKALEMYYEDNRAYPVAGSSITTGEINLSGNAGSQFCHPSLGCSSTTGKVYMQKLPVDPKSSCNYFYVHETSNGEGYSLYSTLENNLDTGKGTGTYSTTDCGGATTCPCKYKLGSANYP